MDLNPNPNPNPNPRNSNQNPPFSPFSQQTLASLSDRRYAYSRQSSFHQFADSRTQSSITPVYSRSVSSIDIPENDCINLWKDSPDLDVNLSLISSLFRALRTANRPMKRLFLLISLNVTYSTAELFIGLLSGRVGLVSDAFHLTFGCGLLTFSLFAMAASRRKPNRVYTYGYKRLEVLAAFTNATAVSPIFVFFFGRGSASRIHTR